MTASSGSISSIFVFVLDAATSKPEKRQRWPLIDPNAAVPADGLYKNLQGDLTTNNQRGDPKDAKNYTEGGPITLVKLRTHAFMRIVLWLITSVTAGAAGVALWAAKEGNADDRLGDRMVTGIYIHLIGTGVTTVVPS